MGQTALVGSYQGQAISRPASSGRDGMQRNTAQAFVVGTYQMWDAVPERGVGSG